MGYLGIPQNRDDGKRASSAIEVADQGASPLKGVWGKQVGEPGISEIFRGYGRPLFLENIVFFHAQNPLKN